MSILEMRVPMDCPGCKIKLKKALKKLEGVEEVDIDIELQKVTVMGWADQRKILKTVRKTGRRAELWSYPYHPDYQNFTQHNYYQQQYYPRNPITNYTFQQPSSSYSCTSYNYKEHHDSRDFDYYCYQQSPYSHHIFDERSRDIFSDENAHAYSYERTDDMFSDENPYACSIM